MNIWLIVSLLLAGFAGGLFTGAKYISKPSNEYSFGKIKVRGEGNKVDAEITQAKMPETKKRRFILLKRKYREQTQQ